MNLLKKIIFAILSVTSISGISCEPITNMNNIHEINSMNSTWSAGVNEFLIDMSVEEAMKNSLLAWLTQTDKKRKP